MILPFRFLHRAALGLAGALFLLSAAATADDFTLYGDTLSWQLTPPEGGAPSYMVGTVHVVYDELRPAIDKALERLRQTGALVVETDTTWPARLAVMSAMMLHDGRTLPDIIGPAQFARLVAITTPAGLPEELMRAMTPSGAATLISVPADQIKAAADGEAAFDLRLVEAALGWRMPVEKLEPIQEQIDLMAGMPEEAQVAMLAEALDMYPQLDGFVARMIERYVADDLAGLGALAMESFGTGPEAEAAMDSFIYARNERMAGRLEPLLLARPHLVAIGALHLPGERGVLALLAARGWTILPAGE